jgi:hypothetical protein
MNATVAISAAVLAIGARASETSQTAQLTVIVCMQNSAGFGVAPRAEQIVNRMFAEAGVAIDWRSRLRNCPSGAILVSLSHQTPGTLLPRALALSRPFEGTHIEIFYDRIYPYNLYNRGALSVVMAHVLAHEIAHILQGLNRHSDSGVMKARWDGADYSQMMWKGLSFTPTDVELIRSGMAVRKAYAASTSATAAH